MARETLTARIALDGGEEIKKELESLGKAGADAFQKLKQAAEKINTPAVRFSASLRKLRADFGALQSAGRVVGRDLVAIGNGFNQIGENARRVATNIGLVTAAALGAGAAVLKFAQSGANAAVQITNQSKALGLTTDAYQDLQAVAKETELDQGDFEKLIARFTIELGENAAKTGAAVKKAGKDIREFGEDVFDAGVKVTSLAEGFTDKERAEKASTKATDDSALSLKSLGVTTTENGEALVAYAKKIASIEDPLQRLAVVSKDFGRKQALAVVPFLEAINRNIAETGKIAGDAIAPLSALELEMGLKLDDALDRLGTTVERTRLRLALLFAAPVERGVSAFDDLIRRNQEAIRSFVDDTITKAIPIIQDFFASISGRDADVKNPAILKMRDQLVQFGSDLRVVVFDVVIPAFHLIAEAARFVADSINAVFGTNITAGEVLIVGALARILGVFRLLNSVVGQVARTLRFFWDSFKLGAAALTVVRSIAVFLAEATVALLTFIAGLVSLPVAIVAAIVAALVAAGVAIFVFWDEIKAAAIATFDFIAIASQAAWNGLVVAATAALDAVLATLGTSREEIGAVFDAIGARIGEAWDSLVDTAKGIGAKIAEAFEDPLRSLGNIFDGVVDSILSSFDDLYKGAKNALDDLISLAKRAAKAIANAFSAGDDAPSGSSGGTPAPGFARGGDVRGRAGRDKIWARLTNREFVMQVPAVRKYGVQFMRAVNSGRLSLQGAMQALGGLDLSGFSSGFGRAISRSVTPGFAAGGPVSVGASGASGHPLTLVMSDGTSFGGLTATPSAAAEITRYAMRRQMRSAGRKPTWYGS